MSNTSDKAALNASTNIGLPRIVDPTLETRFLDDEDAKAISELPLDSAILTTLRNDQSRYLLSQDITVVGRDENADILLDDPSVSRKHAVISRRENKFYIKDTGSLNGTYINHEVHDEEMLLHRGDEIQIGNFRMQFFPSPAATE